MKYRISKSNERVCGTTQLAKLSFNHSIGRIHSRRFSIFYKILIKFRKKEMKTKQKMLRGRCSWRVLPGFGNLWKQNLLREKILRGPAGACVRFFTIFHNKLRASCGRPQCVLPPFAETCSSCSSIPITHSPPSPLSKPPPSSKLRVFSVRRDEHLSIDRPVIFYASPAAAAGFVCYSSGHHIIT